MSAAARDASVANAARVPSPEIETPVAPAAGVPVPETYPAPPTPDSLREFLTQREPAAKLVCSDCTGSFILASAGLLKGRRATSHWVARDTLADFGVTPVDQRVVADGKFITGAGISAGLDMALAAVEALRGRAYAEAQMLQAEYAPVPPFAGGRPDNTAPAITDAMKSMLGGFRAQASAIAKRG